MRKLLLLVAVIICAATIKAQDKPAEQTRIDPPPEIQTAFALSQARIEIAKRDQEILLLRAAQILKVPADWIGRIDSDGRLFFEKPEPVKLKSEDDKTPAKEPTPPAKSD